MRLALVGTGNLAVHLFRRLTSAGHSIDVVYGHSEQGKKRFERLLGCEVSLDYKQIPDVDMVLLAVKDGVIADVASKFAQRPMIHFSGAVSMDLLSFWTEHYGVLYPFQTFSADAEVNWAEIPIFYEASSPDFTDKVAELAKSLSSKIFYLNSQKRLYLHISGVIANNFVNHLLGITKQFVEEKHLDYQWLYPLVKQTVKNAFEHNPQQIQTGPARRGDLSTINKHLLELKDDEIIYDLYKFLTNSILRTYSNLSINEK